MSSNLNPGWGYGAYGYGNWGNSPPGALTSGYYLQLLTSQYQSAPNLQAWLQAAIQPVIDLLNCLAQFSIAFDLDLATGPQLDVLGQIVGQSRTVGFQPSDGVSATLTDSVYRLLLKARVAQNQWTGQIDSLQSIWQTLFPGGTISIVDSQNMTAEIFLTGSFSSIIVDLINQGYIVPRPETVEYTYVTGTLPAFGFDLENSFVSAFDVGHFA